LGKLQKTKQVAQKLKVVVVAAVVVNSEHITSVNSDVKNTTN